MHFLFYVVNFSDIILFNILKYHLNCKLFQKNFSLKESLKDTFLNSFKIYNGTYSFRKKEFCQIWSGKPWKSRNCIIQHLWSPFHQITFYIFLRLPGSNYLITLSSNHFLYFREASWLKYLGCWIMLTG